MNKWIVSYDLKKFEDPPQLICELIFQRRSSRGPGSDVNAWRFCLQLSPVGHSWVHRDALFVFYIEVLNAIMGEYIYNISEQ